MQLQMRLGNRSDHVPAGIGAISNADFPPTDFIIAMPFRFSLDLESTLKFEELYGTKFLISRSLSTSACSNLKLLDLSIRSPSELRFSIVGTRVAKTNSKCLVHFSLIENRQSLHLPAAAQGGPTAWRPLRSCPRT